MLLKSWWVKASRVMPVRRDMVAAKSMRARLPGVLKHQHGEVIALSKDMSIAGILTHSHEHWQQQPGCNMAKLCKKYQWNGFIELCGRPFIRGFFSDCLTL